MCITHTERMAVETEEQREARLQRMHTNQSAAETEEQREARLQRMSVCRGVGNAQKSVRDFEISGTS